MKMRKKIKICSKNKSFLQNQFFNFTKRKKANKPSWNVWQESHPSLTSTGSNSVGHDSAQNLSDAGEIKFSHQTQRALGIIF